MNDGDFRVKYERVDAMKAQITAREAELEAMSPEERSAVVAQVMRSIIDMSFVFIMNS